LNDKAKRAITKIAKELQNNAGGSLVVCGSNDTNEQLLVNAINASLGNYGTTIDLVNHSNQRQGDDKAIYNFANSGTILPIAEVQMRFSFSMQIRHLTCLMQINSLRN